jgi:hypothetical protein
MIGPKDRYFATRHPRTYRRPVNRDGRRHRKLGLVLVICHRLCCRRCVDVHEQLSRALRSATTAETNAARAEANVFADRDVKSVTGFSNGS